MTSETPETRDALPPAPPTGVNGPDGLVAVRCVCGEVLPDGSGLCSACGVYTCSCGTVAPDGQGHCQTCGKFTVWNGDAVKLGLRSKKVRASVEDYGRDVLAALYAERGGEAALDMAVKAACQNTALLCRSIRIVEARIDERGLFNQSGRRNSTYDALLTLVAAFDRARDRLPPVTSGASVGSQAALRDAPTKALAWRLRLMDKGELSEREQGQADVLDSIIDGTLQTDPLPVRQEVTGGNSKETRDV